MDNALEKKLDGTADSIHGRLLEAMHITGYSFERACTELEWLLKEDRWKAVGKGFEDIDDFLATIDFSNFKIAVDQRKALAKQLDSLRATQRATAKVLGVNPATINRDLVANATKPTPKPLPIQEVESDYVANATKPTLEPMTMEKRALTPEEQYEKAYGVPYKPGLKPSTPPRIIEQSGEAVAAIIKKQEEKPHVSNNSGENEWYTPKHIIEMARETMGSIDLDPASSLRANETVKASKYYTTKDNGLIQLWNGNVWMNPPYAQPLIAQFTKAVTDKYTDGEINQACILVNNATETGWFQYMVDSTSSICFITGRIKFIDIDGNSSGAPLQGQAVLYMGDNIKKFTDIFSSIGKVLIHERSQ